MRRLAAGSLGALGIAVTLAMPAAAAAPFSFDAAPGRLPKDVVPRSYAIAIQPDPDTLVLAGQESVVLDFRKSTDTIVFNSLNQQLSDVRLDGRAVSSVVSDDAQQAVGSAGSDRRGRRPVSLGLRRLGALKFLDALESNACLLGGDLLGHAAIALHAQAGD